MHERVYKTEEEWRQQLTGEQYRVLRQREDALEAGGASQPAPGPGLYRCAACGLGLFSPAARLEAAGRLGFRAPWRQSHLCTHEDHSHFRPRTEVSCSRCGSHLGYVLDDGPPPKGLRYSVHPLALSFEPYSH
jgi:peptide-methionine (R)-S-oxide reductase